MPRYFFTVTMADGTVEDSAGATYKGPEQAREAAERIARDLSEDPEFAGCKIEVLDEAGASIAAVVVAPV